MIVINPPNSEPLRVNYRNDFTLTLSIADVNSQHLSWADTDFTAVFFSDSATTSYSASCHNGKYTNCRVLDNGDLQVVFDNHSLRPGALRADIILFLPDPTFSDGTRRLNIPVDCNCQIVQGMVNVDPSSLRVEIPAPMLCGGGVGPAGPKGDRGDKGEKGDSFTFADLTQEQVELLKSPAKEAADECISRVSSIINEEEQRRDSEEMRIANEEIRIQAEAERESSVSALIERKTAELDREGLVHRIEEAKTSVDELTQNVAQAKSIAEISLNTANVASQSINMAYAYATEAKETTSAMDGRITTLESKSVFEEVASEEEWQSRKTAGTLQPNVLYYVPES